MKKARSGALSYGPYRGDPRELKAPDGWRVMETLRGRGMCVPQQCNSSGQCCVCHIKLSEVWTGDMLPPEQLKNTIISLLSDHGENLRLFCQILWTDALDGLTVSLP